MAIKNDMYIANLSFLLNYNDGATTDEMEYEIFTAAFQLPESRHYDRQFGGGFQELEQEPATPATGLKFSTNLIKSVYIVNQKKNYNPYIVVGFSDIRITDNYLKGGDQYLVDVSYRLLQNIKIKGSFGI